MLLVVRCLGWLGSCVGEGVASGVNGYSNSRLCQVAIPLAGLGGSPAAAQPPALACMEYLLHTQTAFTEAIECYSFMLHALWE